MSWTKLAQGEVTSSSSTTAIEFTGISQSYKHMKIVALGASESAAGGGTMAFNNMQITMGTNSYATNSYNWSYRGIAIDNDWGWGGANSSNDCYDTYWHIQYDEPSGNDSGAKRAYSPFEMILFDYANANTRTPVYFAGGTVYSAAYTSGVYGGLIYCMGINIAINAINQIKFELADGGYFSKHTKISLYGLDG
ncbi:MAG: hypothetical protein CMA89_04835 [Euryarchaeota archaeon]|nr:hypothetical protein [Euryarchaeota archaeon]|tara:strand:- start:1482 stop:2063 length:582 start_codon:yes stop_codon:yes gene_type:complete